MESRSYSFGKMHAYAFALFSQLTGITPDATQICFRLCDDPRKVKGATDIPFLCMDETNDLIDVLDLWDNVVEVTSFVFAHGHRTHIVIELYCAYTLGLMDNILFAHIRLIQGRYEKMEKKTTGYGTVILMGGTHLAYAKMTLVGNPIWESVVKCEIVPFNSFAGNLEGLKADLKAKLV